MANDIGIKAIELYFPNTCVDQHDLERADDCVGKYTIGLGQLKMGVCSDLEDVNSIALTVTNNLLKKHNIDPKTIGFLEVGTETLVDKSKSTKSVLMQLFENHGNTDIQGVDVKNACFGGTAAVFAALDWLESSNCDGRLAIVVAADIAVYAEKSARCTGGAGSIAMLLGPNSPLVFDKGVRAHHMSHQWDFYKPKLDCEYPLFDGQLSINCYQKSIDKCFQLYKKKCLDKGIIDKSMVMFRDNYFFCFHSPFTKLVEKSFARLVYNDIRDNSDVAERYRDQLEHLKPFLNINIEDSYGNKDLEKGLLKFSNNMMVPKLYPGMMIAKDNGNIYTASLYSSVVSLLIHSSIDDLSGSRVVLFSYGSGLTSCMFSFSVTKDKELLSHMVSSLRPIIPKLENRTVLSVDEFNTFYKKRNDIHLKCGVAPVTELSYLTAGTFYLKHIDDKYRRHYELYENVNGCVE